MSELSPAIETRPPTAGRAVTELAVTGMTCGNCARHVTEAIQEIPGVHSANVSLDSHHATVRWSPGVEPKTDAVIHAVEEAGYGASVSQAQASHEPVEDKLAGWGLNLRLGLPVTAVLMLGEWAFGLAMVPWFQWLAFGLATVVQVLAGARFYRGAWAQLKVGSSSMDTLVALGSTTAYAYSVFALFSGAGSHLYFMEAVSIITLISVGHWLESRVTVRASTALRQLLNLAPPTARRISEAGVETEVPVTELAPDHKIVLRPGDRVPTDGEILEGESALNESMLTGESIPVDKGPGAQVYAGSTNVNGRLLVRVTAVGEETALAHIIAAVQRAQTSRANIQRLGDRVSSIFVPVVVIAAVAAALWWGFAYEYAAATHAHLAAYLWHTHVPAGALAAAFIVASAVLIIACPCAMGLATPAAIMAGSNAAAERGILIRDGIALEKAGKVSAVLFDKTGTLTAGQPSLASVWVSDGNEAGLRAIGATMAANSTHPVSSAISGCSETRVPLTDWQEVRGAGLQARIGKSGTSQDALLGSIHWLTASGVGTDAGKEFVNYWSAQGATISGLALDGRLQALFAVKDTLKPGAREVTQRLRAQGLHVYMITGDNALTAASVAKDSGIDVSNVFAQVRPGEKADLVRQLQTQGERVAFVGDGINDAPALEQADLGIAVSRASDVAREAADIILLKSEIEAVPESLGLARATLRTIKQNLFWAFFYNCVGVPLAALGFMSPILCAAAMGLSDLIVIGNALRLRTWRMPVT